MQFMSLLGKAEAAGMYESRAKLFGSAQYHAVAQDWDEVATHFKHLATIERALVKLMAETEAVAA